MLGTREAADRLGLAVVGQALAVATARETNLIKTDSVCLGRGLTEAFRSVLKTLPWPDGPRVGYVICDMNGEPVSG